MLNSTYSPIGKNVHRGQEGTLLQEGKLDRANMTSCSCHFSVSLKLLQNKLKGESGKIFLGGEVDNIFLGPEDKF